MIPCNSPFNRLPRESGCNPIGAHRPLLWKITPSRGPSAHGLDPWGRPGPMSQLAWRFPRGHGHRNRSNLGACGIMGPGRRRDGERGPCRDRGPTRRGQLDYSRESGEPNIILSARRPGGEGSSRNGPQGRPSGGRGAQRGCGTARLILPSLRDGPLPLPPEGRRAAGVVA